MVCHASPLNLPNRRTRASPSPCSNSPRFHIYALPLWMGILAQAVTQRSCRRGTRTDTLMQGQDETERLMLTENVQHRHWNTLLSSFALQDPCVIPLSSAPASPLIANLQASHPCLNFTIEDPSRSQEPILLKMTFVSSGGARGIFLGDIIRQFFARSPNNDPRHSSSAPSVPDFDRFGRPCNFSVN